MRQRATLKEAQGFIGGGTVINKDASICPCGVPARQIGCKPVWRITFDQR
jgi:hypothetical protein